MFDHLMLVPSLSCSASCRYCFGPHDGAGVMSLDTVTAAAACAMAADGQRKREVVFHGGEPLTAGLEFYRAALPLLWEGFAGQRLQLSMQSNLWLLTEELCDLFIEHGLSLGTSLDGPEAVNDVQRGEGYFRRTIAGIELARRRGLNVGCICTFTPQSAPLLPEIFDFFLREGLDFAVHAAVPGAPIESGSARATATQISWTLPPDDYGELLVSLLDRYLPNLSRVRISSLDALARSISAGEGGICTFRDCLGGYLAVAPDGGIYPCQRFAGDPAFRLASVFDAPTREELEHTPAWQRFAEREALVREECGDCPHFAYCHGGCPYDVLAAGGGEFRSLRSPYCPAYRRIFDHITDRALEEVFSDENLSAVTEEPGDDLLRRGALLTLLRGE